MRARSLHETLCHMLQDHLLRPPGPLLVVTGAGVSVASGLPVFRGTDPNAVWNREVTERGTLRYFWEQPSPSWSWYHSRFKQVLDAQPNAAHRALVELERWQNARGAKFLLVTQNIDRLHHKAGTEALIEVHGRADKVRCAADAKGCPNAAPKGLLPRVDADFKAFDRDPDEKNIPRCPLCGELLRPHVLWFDERYDGHRDYEIAGALRAAKGAQTMLFVGTSFSVGVTDMILETGLHRGAELFSIDPSGRSPHRRVHVISEAAEEYLPGLVRGLRGAQP